MPAKKRKSKMRGQRLTPEVFAAFDVGDKYALRRALGLSLFSRHRRPSYSSAAAPGPCACSRAARRPGQARGLIVRRLSGYPAQWLPPGVGAFRPHALRSPSHLGQATPWLAGGGPKPLRRPGATEDDAVLNGTHALPNATKRGSIRLDSQII
jgi:hypothetical protein